MHSGHCIGFMLLTSDLNLSRYNKTVPLNLPILTLGCCCDSHSKVRERAKSWYLMWARNSNGSHPLSEKSLLFKATQCGENHWLNHSFWQQTNASTLRANRSDLDGAIMLPPCAWRCFRSIQRPIHKVKNQEVHPGTQGATWITQELTPSATSPIWLIGWSRLRHTVYQKTQSQVEVSSVATDC